MTETEGGRPGSALDAFLAEEGLLEEAMEHTVKSVLAWQIDRKTKRCDPTKAVMARRLRASRG